MKTCAIIIRNLPEQCRRELRSIAALQGRPMNAIIVEIIENYIREAGRGEK